MGLAGTNPFKREPQSSADQWRVVAALSGLINLLPWSQRASDRPKRREEEV